jgi:hypothetical protein
MQEIKRLEVSLKQVTDEEEKKANQEAIEKMQKRLKSLEEIPKQAEIENGESEPGAALDGDSDALHSRH